MKSASYADITNMKDKVSPRLLIALGVAVVLLLGLGAMRVLGADEEATSDQVGEATAQQASDPSDAAVADADPVEEAQADPSAPDDAVDGTPVVADESSDPSDWAVQASQICTQAAADLAALSNAETPDAALDAASQTLAISRGALESLKALPPTPGLEAEIVEYLELLESSLDAVEDVVAVPGNVAPGDLSTLIEQQIAIAARLQELGEQLGIGACVDGAAGDVVTGEESATSQVAEEEVGSKGLRAITDALKENESVVVVVYSPSAELDNQVLRETRAAADESGAGFVAINGNKEREVRLVAETFDLRETPATLVVNEGLVVSSKLIGFADRKTVGQAVTNAHRAS